MHESDRRTEYDVTDSVMVTSAAEVCKSVREIFLSLFEEKYFSPVQQSFEDFDKLFNGEFKGYQACDTFYHDKQHTLDMTLALSRLIEGYQQVSDKENKFTAIYASVGIVTALYHDSGYIRDNEDSNSNGSVYTKTHVSRSAAFLSKYLPMIGLEQYVDIASKIVHYTGYEIKPADIKLPDKRLYTLGHMIGSADLIAQMSDSCYLEKCRDRLYPEFVLGDVAEIKKADGSTQVIYASGDDLLKQTPDFYNLEINGRLNNLFQGAYRYAENHFGTNNLYIDKAESNISRLIDILNKDELNQLSRIPLINNGSVFINDANADEIRRLCNTPKINKN